MSLVLTFRNIEGFLLADTNTSNLVLLCLNRCLRRAYSPGDENNPVRDFMWMAYSRCMFTAHTLFRQTRSSHWCRELDDYNTSLPKIVSLAKAAQVGVQARVRALVGNPKLSLPNTLVSPPCNPRANARYRREVSSWLAWNHRFVQSELHLDDAPPPVHRKKRAKLLWMDGEYVFLTLPSELWRLILDFVTPTPHDVVGMVDASTGFRRVARSHALNKVILHSYLRFHHRRPTTHPITTSYQALVTSINTSRGLLREVQENAHGTYAHLLSITSNPSPSTPEIHQLDHNMLSMYGMDSLMFMHPDLVARRSMLYGPDKPTRQDAAGAGGDYLYDQILSNELAVKVRTMSLEVALDASAASMTDHLTKFLWAMHELHVCVGGGGGDAHEHMLPSMMDQAQSTLGLSQRLASQNTCPAAWMRQVVRHMERALAVRVVQHADIRDSVPPPTFRKIVGVDKWFHYMGGLYHNRGGTCVNMRLAVTPIELGGECTSTSLRYTHISVGGGEEGPQLPVFSICWGWGLWPPTNVTSSTAHVVVVKWGGEFWVRTSSPPTTPQFEHGKTWLQESNADLRGVMTRHGKIIGRCAPCGRTLKHPETWIGSTCSSHLPP